ncbi:MULTISPECIES: PaaI family thioesterase [Giesbergeria]|uniref:PaaI family thioesterase n=1 Tax=Giesbergeria sinuosa TaxID=80883 RepID=A0ABV9QEV9_9BURK
MSTTASIPASLQALLSQTPVTHLLDQQIQALDLAAGTIVVHYQATEQFLNPARQVQGGMLSAMLDDVTAVLVTATLEPGTFCATLSLNTSFLSSAKAGPVIGKARFERQGKNICNVCGELWQGDTLVASATAVCMVRRPSST